MPCTRSRVFSSTRIAMISAESIVQIFRIAGTVDDGNDADLLAKNPVIDGIWRAGQVAYSSRASARRSSELRIPEDVVGTCVKRLEESPSDTRFVFIIPCGCSLGVTDSVFAQVKTQTHGRSMNLR